jgi:hypothetical protein
MITTLLLFTLASTPPSDAPVGTSKELTAQTCYAAAILLEQPIQHSLIFKQRMMNDIVEAYPDKDTLELTGYFLGVELTRLTMEINYGNISKSGVEKDYLSYCNWNI